MKKVYLLIFAGLICMAGFSQSFNKDYEKFVANQKSQLTTADEEFFLLDGTIWARPFGVAEYAIMPSVVSISEYSKRVKGSRFHFVKVSVNEKSKELLNKMNIYVPDYVSNEARVYIPEIDIEDLTSKNISVSYLNDEILLKKRIIEKPLNPLSATIFSEDFEGVFPGTIYNTYVLGGADCGWNDVSCDFFAGGWSVWCASGGTDCNSCGDGYVSDMLSSFHLTNNINTSSYKDLEFFYWINIDLNNYETTDYLKRWQWLGSSWVLGTTYDSDNSADGAGWVSRTVSYQGIYQNYNFDFQMWSDGSWTSEGAYLDDIFLFGTLLSGIDDYEIENKITISPNPSNGHFKVAGSQKIISLEIHNSLGEKIISTENSSEINLSNQPAGVYFVHCLSEKNNTVKKIILEK